MPVDFLTREQQQSYGRFGGAPSPEQLFRYFHLDDTDHQSLTKRRGDQSRLGFAIQLGTVRFLGTFLSNPIDVPRNVIDYVGRQLRITDFTCLDSYKTSETHWDHITEIKKIYGYRDFNEPFEYFKLIRWVYTRAWISEERPSVLFDLATARLVEHKILLPGVTTLTRLIAQIQDRVSARLWQALASLSTKEQRTKLEELLVIPEDYRQSPLDKLRHAPTRISSLSLVNALNRLAEIRSLKVGTLDLSRIPPSRIKALARYAAVTWAPKIARMPDDRRIATLLAFARSFEIIAMDDALDLLDLLMTDLLHGARDDGKKERLRTIRDMDAAALELLKACKVIIDEDHRDKKIKDVLNIVSVDTIQKAASIIESLARPADDDYHNELIKHYLSVRRFLPSLLCTVVFNATKNGQKILEAVQFLKSIEGKSQPKMDNAPRDMIPKSWLRHIIGRDRNINRRAYTLCTLKCLQERLRRRDIYVIDSEKWNDPRSKLLDGEYWKSVKINVCRTLGREETAKNELKELTDQLDEAYRKTSNNLPSNAKVRIECENGQESLTVENLDKLEEPESLISLREKVSALVPQIDLPELLLEIHYRTGFCNEFTHISEEKSRVSDLPVSICAVLVAEACNIGLDPLINENVPALTRGRLSWVKQNYLRAGNLARGNARLVNEQTHIPLTQHWGGGEVASADGLRFVVPIRTLNAGPNSKYFPIGRGITFYNFTSDQFTGFHGIVIPGTLRDSLYILEGLLENQTELNPLEIMADTAGVSNLVFGLFWLLGYQFSPRLADIGETNFWRIDPKADYGLLNNLSRHRIRTRLIEQNWEDMLRTAGSLKLGTIRASELIRSLLGSKNPSTLSRAISELGKIPKTLHMLSYIEDENYRRRILTQLNRGESRHGVGRAIFHGQRGEVRKRYREGQEDQLGALGLVLNAVVLWNTIYMNEAVDSLNSQGDGVNIEDLVRLSPLIHKHINFLGRYSFSVAESIMRGNLRSLRNPQKIEL